MRLPIAALVLALAAGAPARAQDVISPDEVTGLRATKSGADVVLSWDSAVVDMAGRPDTQASAAVYRGAAASFRTDKFGGSNRVGTPAATTWADAGAVTAAGNAFYLVSAVDAAGNEGRTRPPKLAPPTLSASWSLDQIDLAWTPVLPRAQLYRYRVYYGKQSRGYDTVIDVPASLTQWGLFGLDPYVLYYIAVTAVDRDGNESAFSNEGVAALHGDVRVSAMTQGHSVNGGPNPFNGWEPQAAVDFPPALPWTKVTMTLTLQSYLTTPCDCAGAGHCGGDEWDRTIEVFLVTDETCVGDRCAGRWDKTQLELLHAITPFGTDARTGPRVYTIDVTPYAPLLTGRRWIGVQIVTWSGNGYFSDVDFEFWQDPARTSPTPPAAGVLPLFFRDGISAGNQAGIAPTPVTIPAGVTRVMARVFTTGHGGAAPVPPCVNPADEFCQKENRLLVDGTREAWRKLIWKNCSFGCSSFNACGYPSCTYARAGWCPGEITCPDDSLPCQRDIDVTALLPAGETHDVSYEVIDPTAGSSWVYSATLYWY